MKTIVYQSFRTENVPAWIDACMTTVRAWAQQKEFSYRFFDDRFFELVPAEIRPRASEHKCLLTDYARQVAARELLAEGYDRAIWVDADVVIFDAEKFTIDITSGHAFCREVWLDRVYLGFPQFQLTVNNSVCVFCRGETFITPYLEAAYKILAGSTPLTPFSIGTQWLLGQYQRAAFPLITSVGILDPEMVSRYLANDGSYLRPYLRFQTSPVYAINLCHSKSAHDAATDQKLAPQSALKAVEHLLADRGASLNRWYKSESKPFKGQFGRPLSKLLALRMALKRLVKRTRQPESQ